MKSKVLIKNTIKLVALIFSLIVLPFSKTWAEKKKYQEISFSEMDVQGAGRSPDGAYLVQRRGLRFLPLYEVKKNLDSKIRKSVNYLK